jgi:hypothetical protein
MSTHSPISISACMLLNMSLTASPTWSLISSATQIDCRRPKGALWLANAGSGLRQPLLKRCIQLRFACCRFTEVDLRAHVVVRCKDIGRRRDRGLKSFLWACVFRYPGSNGTVARTPKIFATSLGSACIVSRHGEYIRW